MLGVLDAMGTCLERGGCAVVPGLPYNQYQLTLITSLVGGTVFGFSTTIPPQGTLRRLNDERTGQLRPRLCEVSTKMS